VIITLIPGLCHLAVCFIGTIVNDTIECLLLLSMVAAAIWVTWPRSDPEGGFLGKMNCQLMSPVLLKIELRPSSKYDCSLT
jgi:hypothetical protein